MRVSSMIFGLLLAGQLSCSPDGDPSPAEDSTSISPYFEDDPSISTLNGTWKVYCLENLTIKNLEFKTRENSGGQDIIVEFNDTKDPNSFSGIKATNSFGGEFNYVGTRQFNLKGVVTTLAGQPRWADELDKIILEGLTGEVTYTINNEMLCIWYDYKTKAMTFIKQ